MSVLVECSTGAQILPPVKHERAKVTAWFAWLACDADLRTKAKEYRELGNRLGMRADGSD